VRQPGVDVRSESCEPSEQDNTDRVGDDSAMRRLPVLAALAAAIALAVPAHADPDPNDAQFIDALNKAGITYHSPEEAINAGKQVCALMSRGQSGPAVVQQMTQANPGFAEAGAQQFAAIAATVYCPQYVHGSGTGGN
jgi:Protein of unknown function (DUF732)